MRATVALTLSLLLAVTACAPKAGQNVYKEGEIGKSRAVEFGTVLNKREIEIIGKDSGIGTLGGAGVGAGAGSYVGGGSGNAWATAGAAVAGAVMGTLAERELNKRVGYEYIVNMQDGETKTITQEQHEGDAVIKVGQHVMLQYCDRGDQGRQCTEGSDYQRLMPVEKLPVYAKKKRKLIKG